MIVLRRTGGLRMPQFREVLEVWDDGAFQMWRSVSMASALPSPIGRFGGRIPDAQWAKLKNAASRATAAGSQSLRISPDSPVDQVEVGGATLTLGIHDDGKGPWKALVQQLRAMLKDLTDSPIAAIALEVDGGPRLIHLGSQPLELDLSQLTVRAVHWREGSSEGQWSGGAPGKAAVSAGPGWSFVLPFDHGFSLKKGDHVAVSVTLSARDGELTIPVGLQSP